MRDGAYQAVLRSGASSSARIGDPAVNGAVD